MNDLLSTLGHSAIWSGVRMLARDHPYLVVPLIGAGALLLIWRAHWIDPRFLRKARR